MKKSGLWLKRDDEEIDAILPFMSLLLIIIPVLLSNLSFYQFRVINVSTPGSSKSEPESTEMPPPQKEKMITAYLELFEQEAKISFLDEETAEPVYTSNKSLNDEGAKELFEMLKKYKKDYPKLENLMLKIDKNLSYDKIANFITVFKQPVLTEESNANEGTPKVEKQHVVNIILLREFAENKLEQKEK